MSPLYSRWIDFWRWLRNEKIGFKLDDEKLIHKFRQKVQPDHSCPYCRGLRCPCNCEKDCRAGVEWNSCHLCPKSSEYTEWYSKWREKMDEIQRNK